jgi:hypothetical protein
MSEENVEIIRQEYEFFNRTGELIDVARRDGGPSRKTPR